VLNEWKWCGVDLLSITVAWALVALPRCFAAERYLVGNVSWSILRPAGRRRDRVDRDELQQFAASRSTTPRPSPSGPPRRAGGFGRDRTDWREIALERRAALHAPRGDRPALVDATLRLRRERIALVGPSGAGKTLLRVLGGL
jgi:ABC-type multidrug transport system fused ATPase/permease subunit